MTALENAAHATGPTAQLASHVSQLRFEDLDPRTVERTKQHILDSIGAVLAGAGQQATEIAERAALRFGGRGETPTAGRHERHDLLTSAFLQGAAAHGLELDDGYRAGSTHPGAVIVPALLAAGYAGAVSGQDAITATVAGYEAMCRLAAVCHPRSRWRGFHNTATTGVFGAAAVWASLGGFSPERTEAAFGIAASTASGLFTFLDGGEVKRLHAGFAAGNGLLAGLLAEEGLAGPPGALESPNGFLHAYAGDDDGALDYTTLDLLSVGPGSPHAITECYIKPHACCRHIHSAIDAVLDMQRSDGLTVDDVVSLHIGTYRVATTHDLRTWDDFTAAQMSIPFAVATALRFGAVDLGHFSSPRRADRETAALAEKISVSLDESCDSSYPHTRSAVTTVQTKAGAELERRVDEPLGAPANPIDEAALRVKFRNLAAPVVGPSTAAELIDQVQSLESADDLRPLIEKLAPLGKARG